MRSLLVDAFSFNKPVKQRIAGNTETTIFRAASWTTTAAVASIIFKLISSRPWNQRSRLSTFFSVNNFLGDSLKAKAFSIAALGVVAYLTYKLEFSRGRNALQHKLAKETYLSSEERQFIADNPSAVRETLKNEFINSSALLRAILDVGSFHSYKSFVHYFIEKNVKLTPTQFIMTIVSQNLHMVAYILRTKDALPELSKNNIIECWYATTTDDIAKKLKDNNYDINTQNEAGLSALVYTILYYGEEQLHEKSLDQAKFLIRHGAKLNLDNCKEETIALLKDKVSKDDEWKEVLENDRVAQEMIFGTPPQTNR